MALTRGTREGAGISDRGLPQNEHAGPDITCRKGRRLEARRAEPCPAAPAPRDFDISPYFMVVKPTLARGFNYKDMQWADLLQVHTAQVPLAAETEGAIAQVA